jgi:hypothetical protein
MGYVSIAAWRDLEDGHLYKCGEEFPHDGRVIPDNRIEALSSTQNKAGFALIMAVPDKAEEKPVQAAEAPKKAVKSRKKTT